MFPSSFHQQSANPASEPDGAASSPLFALVPPEIRRQILVTAFGGRTIHLSEIWTEARLNFCGNHRQIHGFFCSLERYASSSVSPYSPSYAASHAPHSYACAATEHNNMGATGWLRACRRAHDEGADVLYATNVFNVESLAVTYALPCIMSRLNRARIQHAQLEWVDLLPWPDGFDYLEHGQEEGPIEPVRLDVVDPIVGCMKAIYVGMRAFSEPSTKLSLWLPSLRFLYLSLSGTGTLLPSNPRTTSAKDICDSVGSLLGHVDNAFKEFRKRGQFSHWCIALPSECYGPLKSSGTEYEGRRQYITKSGAIWRSVVSEGVLESGEEDAKAQDPNVELLSVSGLAPEAQGCGYWVMGDEWGIRLPSPPGHRLSRAARLSSYLAA
jgi:hypothetical protein